MFERFMILGRFCSYAIVTLIFIPSPIYGQSTKYTSLTQKLNIGQLEMSKFQNSILKHVYSSRSVKQHLSWKKYFLKIFNCRSFLGEYSRSLPRFKFCFFSKCIKFVYRMLFSQNMCVGSFSLSDVHFY